MNRSLQKLIALLLVDSDLDEMISFLLRWSFRTSPTNMYLAQRRAIAERLIADRRLGVSNFVIDLVPRYCGVQFCEHFRMAPATFEVNGLNIDFFADTHINIIL